MAVSAEFILGNMTQGIMLEGEVAQIVDQGHLSEEAKQGLIARTSGQTASLKGALAGVMGISPGLHFTTDKFRFRPESRQDREQFMKKSLLMPWTVINEADGGFYVETGYSDSIRNRGLRANSCVGIMPEGDNRELMQRHPRFFLEGLRRTVVRFGKHAIPYKQPPFRRVNGVLTDIEAAVAIVPFSSDLFPKGGGVRGELSPSNLLRPSTHITSRALGPDEILGVVPFHITRDISLLSAGTAVIHADNFTLANDILIGLLQGAEDLADSLKERGIPADRELVRRMVRVFNGFCGRNWGMAEASVLNCSFNGSKRETIFS